MRIDISLLPALAAAFMLVFARVSAMVMLLPGLGESNIPVRIKLAIAVLLTLIILPLHRTSYTIDMHDLRTLHQPPMIRDDIRIMWLCSASAINGNASSRVTKIARILGTNTSVCS